MAAKVPLPCVLWFWKSYSCRVATSPRYQAPHLIACSGARLAEKSDHRILVALVMTLEKAFDDPTYNYFFAGTHLAKSCLRLYRPGLGQCDHVRNHRFFVAAGMLIKTYWYKLKSFFTGGAGKGQQDTANTDVGDERIPLSRFQAVLCPGWATF